MPRETNTRARMIETAAHLLWTQGFHATGLNQILDESATPKGSLYFHFPGGKEQLAVEALRSAGGVVTTAIVQRIGRHENVADGFRDFFAAFARGLERSDFERGCPAATVTLEASAKSDALRQVCDDLYNEWQRLIAERLTASGMSAKRAGSFAMFILSAVEGALILSRASRSVKPIETVGEEIARLLEDVDPASAPRRRRP